MNIPQCGIKLHSGNFSAIGKLLQEQLESGRPLRLQVKEWREKRSISQNSLSHMWYQEISEYLIASGRTDATPDSVKRNLKKTYLGCEEVTYTDFITGTKKPPGNLATRLNSIPERCTSFCAKSKRGALSSAWR